ncbi:unnamed protein product, partial [marine sediment metagenome]
VLTDQQPEHAAAHYHFGRTLDAHVQRGKGLKHLLKAVSLDPQNSLYRFHLAHSTIHAGNPDLAHTQLDWLLKQSPANVDYFCTRGFAFRQAERWDEAEAAYQDAINASQTSTDRARALKYLAQTIMQQEDPQQWEVAWKLLERAWALHLSDPTIFGTRKQLAEKLGRSIQIDKPYKLIRERLELGDPITVQVYRIDRAKGIQVYYYGVPGWLPWVEGGDEFETSEQIEDVVVQSIDDEGNLRLLFPLLEKTRQMGLEPGRCIDAVV